MKKIILILIFIALIFVANLSMTYPALYGVNIVAILVTLFGLLFYKPKNQATKTWKEKLKPSKGVIVFLIIIIIIGGWGVGWYAESLQSYILKQKIHSATENHTRAKDTITTYFEKCSTGASVLQLKVNSQTTMTNVNCNSSMSQFADYWAKHFNNDGWENPYNSESTFARKVSGSGPLGELRLYYSGNNLTISTNVGNVEYGDVYLNDTIVKE